MGQSKRPMPVRQDLWQPHDPILDTIIRRCLSEAESTEGSEGGSTIMGGAIMLAYALWAFQRHAWQTSPAPEQATIGAVG